MSIISIQTKKVLLTGFDIHILRSFINNLGDKTQFCEDLILWDNFIKSLKFICLSEVVIP